MGALSVGLARHTHTHTHITALALSRVKKSSPSSDHLTNPLVLDCKTQNGPGEDLIKEGRWGERGGTQQTTRGLSNSCCEQRFHHDHTMRTRNHSLSLFL